tara:strand:+ start:1109 stop:2584 length:1476 start_codon:yes stop_codon:yes gene_type:complete
MGNGNSSPLIDSIRLENFKAFQDTGTIPLKKITLLVGKNSAGKSSLIKGILASAQTARQDSQDNSIFRLVGPLTNLGTFKDTVFQNKKEGEFSIQFGKSGREGITGRGFSASGFDNIIQYKYRLTSDEQNPLIGNIAGVECKVDETLIFSSGRPRLKQPSLHSKILTKLKFGSKKVFEVEKADQSEVDYTHLPKPIRNIMQQIKELNQGESDIGETAYNIEIQNFSVRFPTKQKETNELFRNTIGLVRKVGFTEPHTMDLTRDLQRLIYISGIRDEPSREARLAQSTGNRIGNKGEDLPMELHRRMENEPFMKKFNHNLSMIGVGDSAITMPSYTKGPDGKQYETGYIKIMLEVGGELRSLMDLGYGTSQILPVIFELSLRRNRIIVIEQPELHLHPGAQSEIGTLLAESIKDGNQLIIETHSPNIIERLKKLIRKGELSADDVNIIYVGKTDENKGSYCNVIGFDEKGKFTEKWPEVTFFGEREMELIDW